MAGQPCAHVRANGERCRGYAVIGGRFCFAHDPALADKRADDRRRGGEAGKVAPLADSAFAVRSLGDVLALIETTINDVRAGRVDVKVANAVGYLANVAVKVMQQTDIEARLDALESVLEADRIGAVALRRRAA